MDKKFKIAVTTGLVAVVIGGWYGWSRTQVPTVIGGERDAQGCLTAAGYTFDEMVGACTRAFELTPDIRRAAGLAVVSAGRGYALTVASFNSYEDIGAYDITLERGLERTRQTVSIRNWQVAPVNTVSYVCKGGKTITAAYYQGENKPAPAPGEPPTPTGSVALTLSDGRTMTLSRTLSADGLRYANADESFIFWGKGDGALVLENNQEKSYTDCVTRI